MLTKRRDRRLTRALEAHRIAVARFEERAARAADWWTAPRAPGAWSAAEITEHLALVFEAVAAELEGEDGIRLRFDPLRRLLFRTIALPPILAGKRFPAGVKSVREARPEKVTASPDASIGRFRRAANRFEAAAQSAPAGARITHPFFGRLPLERAVRFSTAHIDHHAAQLPQTRPA